MMVKNLVSIIVPYFNHKDFIEELLISIKNQTYNNLEIIVINDGSSDGSLKLLKYLKSKYSFNLYTQKNKGICATLNRGLSLARGEFINLIGSDDVLFKTKIDDQVKILSQNDYDAVAGGIALITKESIQLNTLKPRIKGILSLNDVFFNNSVFSPTLMFRASAFKKFGKYDERNSIDDYPMLLNMLDKGAKIFNFNEIWAYYRVSEENYMKKSKWYLDGILFSLAKYENKYSISKIKNYHNFIYYLKSAIFDDSFSFKVFKNIFKMDDSLIKNLLRFLIIFFVNLFPNYLKKILQNKIIFKSAKVNRLSRVIR